MNFIFFRIVSSNVWQGGLNMNSLWRIEQSSRHAEISSASINTISELELTWFSTASPPVMDKILVAVNIQGHEHTAIYCIESYSFSELLRLMTFVNVSTYDGLQGIYWKHTGWVVRQLNHIRHHCNWTKQDLGRWFRMCFHNISAYQGWTKNL